MRDAQRSTWAEKRDEPLGAAIGICDLYQGGLNGRVRCIKLSRHDIAGGIERGLGGKGRPQFLGRAKSP
jgi:hypothetical protein